MYGWFDFPFFLDRPQWVGAHIPTRPPVVMIGLLVALLVKPETCFLDSSIILVNVKVNKRYIVGSLTKPRNCKKTNFSGEAKN